MKKFLTTLSCALIAASTTFAGEYPDVSITELQELIQAKKVIVLDVNGTKSYERGHVPGAIDFAANQSKIADVLAKASEGNKDITVVAYCGGPTCSAYTKGASAAKEAGFTDVKHLSAGISGWLAANADVEKAGAEKKAKKEKASS
jgi:rhodanese-related sulfurtransferase